ncbi:hypothetical protein HID58_017453 [Brassica napus]|uniref:Uncharacterized protein n=3 Tax=Brassica TaxID=3705 RepID=A0ABQ8D747_BRANA|nr:hypothetical protein HID58_017453 [Brassica napus]
MFIVVVRCGVLAVEIEHVDVETLEKLEKQGIGDIEGAERAGEDQQLATDVAQKAVGSLEGAGFEQHSRAVVGLPLGDPSMRTPSSIMYNFLGEDDGEAGFRLAHRLIAGLWLIVFICNLSS